MAFRGIWIGAAGFIAILAAHSPVHAGDNRLQTERSGNAALSDHVAPHINAPRALPLLDEDLPDAPDLDAIPFLAARDSALYGRMDVGFGAAFAHEALTRNGRFNPTLSGPALFGVGLGYKIGLVLRGEVAAEYRSRASVQTADGFRAHTSGANVLANVYADIGTWYGVTPYIGAGAGVGWSALSIAGAFKDQDRTDFVWALTGGFAVEVRPKVTFDIGYRYLETGTRRSPVLTLRESGTHDLRIGLRWRFGETTESADLP